MKETKPTSLSATKQAKEILANGDWTDGYQFRHSDYFFIHKLDVKADRNASKINVSFVLEYKTKSHKVINNICWSYSYKNINKLKSDMEYLEVDILKNTSDPDRTDQVFGKTFRKQLFEDRDYASKGWVIKK